VYKNVTGDFKVAATFHARRDSQHSLPPSGYAHLGGLMARDASGPPENYTFIVVGRDVDDLSVETKKTHDGASDYVGPSGPNGDAELRLCRVGQIFRLYNRAPGAMVWTLAITYDRTLTTTMAATMQVGININADSATHDLRVEVEGITLTQAGDCTAD
jgi:hypothetical protein